MCTCAILSLLRLEINIANTTADILKMKDNQLGLYPKEGPVPKAPTAPFTLRHGVLLEVVDLSRCRKMFAVQSRERPPRRRSNYRSPERPLGRRRSRSAGVEEDDLAGELSRKTLPKNLIARTSEQVSRCRTSGSGGLLSRSLCAQRFGTGTNKEQLDRR